MTREEYKREPDEMKIKDVIRLFNEYFLPKKTRTTIAENFFGPDTQKLKNRKTSGVDL